jgi:hypothetical protein
VETPVATDLTSTGTTSSSTFNTLTEEGHKAFEAYYADLEELFLSRYEMMW